MIDPANFYARLASSIDADTRRKKAALRPSDAAACSPSLRLHFNSRDELLEQLCIKQFGAFPVYDENAKVEARDQ